MKLWYNAIALHNIGTVALMEESAEYVPADSAQRRTVRLTFRIDVWLQSFTDNRAKMVEVQAALNTQNAVLKVTQLTIPTQPLSSEVTLYDQTSRIVSHNFPSDINEWGTTHQRILVTFEVAKHDLVTNTLTANFGAGPIVMGTVTKWKERLVAKRVDVMRSIRENVEGEVVATGEFLGNMSQTLADRRTTLATLKEAWLNGMNQKSGTLVYGTFFNKVVKMEDINCDIDQATERLAWSFTAKYTRFPNEAGYAFAEYEVSNRKDSETGDLFLTLSGRIMAESLVRATAKLDAVRTAVLAANSFTSSRQTKKEVKDKNVSQQSFEAGETSDGDAFIEITFSEEYRKRDDTHLSWNLSVDTTEDIETGIITATYSGSVSCGYLAGSPPGGLSEADAAFSIAVEKAKLLGANKHDFKVRSQIKRDDRVTTVSATQEMVKVDFSYVYKFKGTRIYLEIRSETNVQTFGENSTSVSGFIVGGDTAAMTAVYDSIVALYPGKIVRESSKTIGENRVRTGTDDGPSPNTDFSPTSLMHFAPSPSTYSSLIHRLDFGFKVYEPKGAGIYAIKYGMKVAMNYTTLMKTTTVSGTMVGEAALIVAAQAGAVNNKLDILLSAMSLGSPLESEREIDYEYVPTITAGQGEAMLMKFSQSYVSRIVGDDTIIECDVTEKIQFSGNRNVVLPIPDRIVEVQRLGTVEGRRTISGNVTASNETAALRWVKKMKAMVLRPTGAGLADWTTVNLADTALVYEEPPTIDIQSTFVPFTDGEVRGGDASKAPNAVRVSFSFSSIIPNYPFAL